MLEILSLRLRFFRVLREKDIRKNSISNNETVLHSTVDGTVLLFQENSSLYWGILGNFYVRLMDYVYFGGKW